MLLSPKQKKGKRLMGAQDKSKYKKCLSSQNKDILKSDENTVTASPSQLKRQILPRQLGASLPLGERFGSYQIIRLLGKGGMGEVYEAEHLESSRRVAVKVLSQALRTKTDRERFLREGRLAASINHPNSIYIFGTEEIDGTPVITMELVPGGTLKDRIKEEGPLPPKLAVDAILQVIEGLEAAQSVGILHRDIKPSNCFVGADDTVKIGDFGLSLSTLTRGETQLTTTGTFIGTPAFSSPEQLRGEKFDVRSDIYSLGATLYYMLTGRAPFEEQNVIKLVSRILEKIPEPPKSFKPEIAPGLAKTVMHCLEKKQSTRFSSYSELKKALIPFSTIILTPASLWPRISAKFFDFVLCVVIFTLADFLPEYEPISMVLLWIALLYFFLTEGIWGVSFGKLAYKLRVVGPRGENPGIPRRLLRVFIFILAVFVIPLLITRVLSAFGLQTLGLISLLLLPFLFSFILLLPAKQRNEFAGLHDLICKTRVIQKKREKYQPIIVTGEKTIPIPETQIRIGPYLILSDLRKSDSDELILCYDEKLRRKIWLHIQSTDTPAVSTVRRDVSQRGRLRWINGKRSSRECWDAYEALEGKALLEAIGSKQSWSTVRHWILDLAEAINAGLKDKSLPATIELDRVWIIPDGRAKLLDFQAPGISNHLQIPFSVRAAIDSSSLHLFLKQVALSSLEGNIESFDKIRDKAPNLPLPLHARSFLENLASHDDMDFDPLVLNLKTLIERDARISVLKRLRLMGLTMTPFIFIPLYALSIVFSERDIGMIKGIGMWLGYWGVLSLIMAMLYRGGHSYAYLGVAVVMSDGSQVSRLRALMRSLIAWSPGILCSLLAVIWSGKILYPFTEIIAQIPYPIWLYFSLVIIFILGGLWAVIIPERGPQDRIVGTYLVPR